MNNELVPTTLKCGGFLTSSLYRPVTDSAILSQLFAYTTLCSFALCSYIMEYRMFVQFSQWLPSCMLLRYELSYPCCVVTLCAHMCKVGLSNRLCVSLSPSQKYWKMLQAGYVPKAFRGFIVNTNNEYAHSGQLHT